ncbi:MAG: type II toxin-antitoxin system RelE/ParE family toxin [Desulfobulbaceae bacterium]|jgi:mRNA interferase RelE/StbE|nr:type II toxin-antitoxin system RelE/ParE family toxin [Desulfobulbaceae bacterium]
MKIYQSRSFAKKVKKLAKPEKETLDKAIQEILNDPEIGDEKKGDLRGVFVHKFKVQATPYLLSYRFTMNELELIMLGAHENYYRDLKKII